eukprot:TRINITY_DN2547_c2_g1_i1.p1 TRINITY_DN2547_c2_g1~~TRINITY_DN2547_c2_g1_i1.p1  ORF type:complete len:1031 (+),score=181.01 TRINITY_DN2547_c2_g1_i1:43-3093(+)
MSMEEAVAAVLAELATALTTTPAALPAVEKKLSDLRVSDGGQFSKGLCKALIESENDVIQHAAGLVLKQHLNTDEGSRHDESIRKTLLLGLSHPKIRTVSSTCIVTCLQDNPQTWQGLIPTVMGLMQQPPYYEGAMMCLEHLLDRFPNSGMGIQMLGLIPAILGRNEPSEGALNLLQELFTLSTRQPGDLSSSPEQRRQADEVEEQILSAHHEYIGSYLQYLTRYLDGSQPVKLLCVAFRNISDTVMLWTSKTKALWKPLLQTCVQYLSDSVPHIAGDHLELIRIFAVGTIRQASILETCTNYFKQELLKGPLLHALLNGLLWSDLSLSTDANLTNEHDSTQPDPEYLPSDDRFNKNEDEEHEPESDELTDALLKKFKSDHNHGLRSQTQFCLGTISTEFGDFLCEPLMETCGTKMQHENWKYREAAITLLGVCIPETAYELLRRGMLAQILSALQKSIQSDPYALVRAASIWCVEQMGDGLLEYLSMFDDSDSDSSECLADPGSATSFIDTQCIPTLQGSLQDPNKRCQRNAIMGLTSLASTSPTISCNDAIHAVIDLLPKYQLYNRCKVFSSVVSALSVPSPDKVVGVVDKLASHCDRVISTGNNLVKSSELPYILAACAKGILSEDSVSEQSALKLLEQAFIVVRTVHEACSGHHFWGLNSAVCALDVVSMLADVCPEVFAKHAVHIKSLLEITLTLGSSEALAATESTAGDRRAIIDCCASLSGDLAVKSFPVISSLAPAILQFLSYHATQGLDSGESHSSRSRASVAKSNIYWASSEIIHRADMEHIRPFLAGYAKMGVETMKELAGGRKGVRCFRQNVAGLLGKVAGRDASVLLNPQCGFSGDVLVEWANSTSEIDDCDEKHENVIGMGSLLRTTSDPSLWVIYGLILVRYKRLGLASIPPPIKQLIENLCSVVHSVPPPKADSIKFVFEFFRPNDVKTWTHEAVANLSKASGASPPDEAAWKYLCSMHGSSRHAGLRAENVRSMYAQGMRNAEQDYTTAVKTMLHEMSL